MMRARAYRFIVTSYETVTYRNIAALPLMTTIEIILI